MVVVHFGNGDLAAYDFAGKRLWRRNLQEDFGPYTIWWGHANSPVLYQDLVISVCMQDTCADLDEFRQALPKLPGRPRQAHGRAEVENHAADRRQAEACDSYTTPLLWKHGDRLEMIVMGGQILDGYDPATGKRLWYLPGLTGNRVITGPVVAGDVVYFTQGMRQPVLAVKLGGRGESPEVGHPLGTPPRHARQPNARGLGRPLVPGQRQRHRPVPGRQDRQGPLGAALKGDYRASPLAAEGRIYFLNMKGLATVVSASANFEKLAENQLDDQTIASPIVSDGRIFIRGQKTLYCLGKSP